MFILINNNCKLLARAITELWKDTGHEKYIISWEVILKNILKFKDEPQGVMFWNYESEAD